MTVRELKDFCLEKAGVSRPGEFVDLSEKHRDFLCKLNRLGARNIETHPPEEFSDIDSTVKLSKKEVRELKKEFKALN